MTVLLPSQAQYAAPPKPGFPGFRVFALHSSAALRSAPERLQRPSNPCHESGRVVRFSEHVNSPVLVRKHQNWQGWAFMPIPESLPQAKRLKNPPKNTKTPPNRLTAKVFFCYNPLETGGVLWTVKAL